MTGGMIGRLFKSGPSPGRRQAPQVPPGQRVYAVGDIHGRSDLVDTLHALITGDMAGAGATEGHVVYLGDYVDRGPDSAGVLERLARPAPAGLKRTLLKGNHEAMLQRFLADASAGTAWRQLGGMATLLSYRIDVAGVLAAEGFQGLTAALKRTMPAQHQELLAGLPSSATVGDYFFCHAGVRPGIALERQEERDLIWIRDEFLDSGADFGKVVVHGHTPVERPELRANRINIDTGAYATGRLTCLVLEGEVQRIVTT